MKSRALNGNNPQLLIEYQRCRSGFVEKPSAPSAESTTWRGLCPSLMYHTTRENRRFASLAHCLNRPSAAIHSFLMFVPFFVVRPNSIPQGVFLFATGPLLAGYITPDLQEQVTVLFLLLHLTVLGLHLVLLQHHANRHHGVSDP